jgi:hypothetical protein
MSEKILSTWEDFQHVNITQSMFYEKFKDKRGNGSTKPDKVHLNDDFCMTYNWMSYNIQGDMEVYSVNTTPKLRVANERTLVNNSNNEFKQSIKVSTTQTKSAEVSVEQSSGISTTAKISMSADIFGAKIGAEFSTSFNVENKVGSKSTESLEVNVEDDVEVTVPPQSQVTVKLEVAWMSESCKWRIPVEIDGNGWAGAQFPKRVNGHYYWGAPLSLLFPDKLPLKTYISGEFQAAYDMKGKTIVGPPQKIV